VPGQVSRCYRIEQALEPAEDDLFTYRLLDDSQSVL
jgi:hypothetical protein